MQVNKKYNLHYYPKASKMPTFAWPSENTTALLPSALATIQSSSDQSSNNGTDTVAIIFGIMGTMISLGGLAIGYRQLRLTWQHRRQTEEQSLQDGSTTMPETYGLPNVSLCSLPAANNSDDQSPMSGLTGVSDVQAAAVSPQAR